MDKIEIEILKQLVASMEGTVIIASDRAVGFRDVDKTFRKFFLQGDAVILEQVSGPERGKQAEVATMSNLLQAFNSTLS